MLLPRPRAPGYGCSAQHAEDGTSRKLSKDEAKRAQKAVGKFLLLARATGSAMLHGPSSAAGVSFFLLSVFSCRKSLPCQAKPGPMRERLLGSNTKDWEGGWVSA